jgi:starch-binding outer membrane protein, SusD/RagB family
MNKILLILSTTLVVLFTCCSDDFLERENPSTLSIDNFFKTENDFRIAMAGVYNVLVRSDYYNGYLARYLEIASDDAHPGDDADYNAIVGDEINNFTMTPESYTAINIFSSSYMGIARANTTIDKIRTSDLNQSFKIQIEAEARFLRALYYFNLVRLYGAVPLFLKEITDPQEVFIPRTPVMEVYETGIIPDLLFASQNLPAAYGGEDISRATNWAAKALLAKVYLTLGSMDNTFYPKSRDLLWEIIISNQFSLENNFADLYKRENEFGKESIFEINFMSGQHFYYWEGFGVGNYIPQRNGIGSYYNLFYSPRFQGGSDGAWSKQGYGIVIPTTSNDPRAEIYNVPANTGIVEAFGIDDHRRDVTILDYYLAADSLYKDSLIKKPVDKNLAPFNIAKYSDWEDNDNGEADDNFFILRLADVYLMFAEAENEINNGPTSQAYEYLNRVRRRAYEKDINDPSDIDYSGLGYEQFLDKVYLERRLELAFEGQRWFDLIRRPQRALKVLQAQNKTNVSVERLLLPIPQYVINEMNVNQELILQNPGY